MEDMFNHQYELPTGLSDRLAMAMRQIEFARNYTLSLLEDLTDDEWFWSPGEYDTHIAWQVGHLAMSEYGLTLFRQRGRVSEDMELMSGKFRKLFLRGSQPVTDRSRYPSPDEIREVLDRVHQQMRTECRGLKACWTKKADHLTRRLRPSTVRCCSRRITNFFTQARSECCGV